MTPEQDVIAGCVAAIQALRSHDSTALSFNHMEIVFHIFLKDGVTRKELASRIPNLSRDMIQRYVRDIVTDLNLAVEIENDQDSRFKHLHLNERGYRIIETVVHKMQDCATCLK